MDVASGRDLPGEEEHKVLHAWNMMLSEEWFMLFVLIKFRKFEIA